MTLTPTFSTRKNKTATNTSKRPALQASGSSKKGRIECSRGQVGKSGKNASIEAQAASSHVVCSVVENLARETAIASIDCLNPTTLTILKQSNSLSYNETLLALDVLAPDEIIVNEGRKGSALVKKVCSYYQNAPRPQDDSAPSPSPHSNFVTVVKPISRVHFDQTKGAELLSKVALSSTFNSDMLTEFIVPSAANAALTYCQGTTSVTFSPHCLSISLNASELNSRMTIDRSTIMNLELLTNSRSVQKKQSLFHTIDNTITSVGSHLLRSNLIAPSISEPTINGRLDLVDLFLGNEGLFYSVLDSMEQLPDLERMLSGLTVRDRGVDKTNITVQQTSNGIGSLIAIKTTLESIPALVLGISGFVEEAKMMEKIPHGGNEQAQTPVRPLPADLTTPMSAKSNATASTSATTAHNKCQLAEAICTILADDALGEVLEAVKDTFTESTAYTKNKHAMRHQECFALRPGTDGMMDVLRKAFLANVDDIYAYADTLADEAGITVSVRVKARRGYYLCIPLEFANKLPREVIQPVKSGNFIHCTTNEVFSLNARAQENVQDLLLLTYHKIQEVLDFARERMEALCGMADAIALLDMCHSFSDVVASSRKKWCRPVVTGSHGSLAIREGRYAIDFENSGNGAMPCDFVPNDTFASQMDNFTLVSGVNGGGKSTYLKQIGLIVVLAQIGSYVPAEEAFIPLRDMICTRIGTGDDFEHNISSFMLEMKEAAYICENVTPKSLVLIDELGRATSNEDGVAIAWAVAEHLLMSKAVTFFVTHYSGMYSLETLYENVRCMSFGRLVIEGGGEEGGEDGGRPILVYDHNCIASSCKVESHYGIDMAKVCGWQDGVVEKAKLIRRYIVDKIGGDGGMKIDVGRGKKEIQAREKLAEITRSLALLVQGGRGELSLEVKREFLAGIRRKIGEDDPQELLEMLEGMTEKGRIAEEDVKMEVI